MGRLRAVGRWLAAAPWSQLACGLALAVVAYVLSGVLGTAPAHAILGIDVGNVVDEALGKLLDLFFDDVPTFVSKDIVGWLVALEDPMSADHRALQRIERTTAAAAWGMLGLLVTLAVFRYWLAGLGGRGGFEALQGLWRGTAAAALLVTWPWLFSNAVLLVNTLTHGLLTASTRANTASLIGDALGPADGASLFIVRLVAGLVGVLLSIALFCMKVMLTASLDVVFACAPLAIALWVLPEADWLARFVSRTFVALLVWPIVWVVCFAVFGAIGVETLTPTGEARELIKPFVAIALLYLCLKLPFVILNATSVLDGPGGGFAGSTARYVVSRSIYDRVSGRHGASQRTDARGTSAGAGPAGPGGGGGGQGGGSGPRRPQGGGGPSAPAGTAEAQRTGGAQGGVAAPAKTAGAGALVASATALSAEPVAARASNARGPRPAATGEPARPTDGREDPLRPVRPQRPAGTERGATQTVAPVAPQPRSDPPVRPVPSGGDGQPALASASAGGDGFDALLATSRSTGGAGASRSQDAAGTPAAASAPSASRAAPPSPSRRSGRAGGPSVRPGGPTVSRRQPSFLA